MKERPVPAIWWEINTKRNPPTSGAGQDSSLAKGDDIPRRVFLHPPHCSPDTPPNAMRSCAMRDSVCMACVLTMIKDASQRRIPLTQPRMREKANKCCPTADVQGIPYMDMIGHVTFKPSIYVHNK